MLDAAARQIIDDPLNRLGRRIARHGITADQMTAIGLLTGLAAAAAIMAGAFLIAIVLIVLSRLADGLDGAVARATRKSDIGGVLDISADFVVYAAIPLAFVLADPARHGAAGAFLIASFYVNGGTFLGTAILAERTGRVSSELGRKSFFHSRGLLEGTETIAFLILICALPQYFPVLAWTFGGLCVITALLRLAALRRDHGRNEAGAPA